MPKKPVGELYNALGFNKHGKTELYRDLLRHLAAADDLFVEAPGTRGMVMLVFTLPSYDVVFKVIRDSFAPPKTASRKDVLDKYRLVFRHTRAGRLADVQEFEHLSFPVARFDPALLDTPSEGGGRDRRGPRRRGRPPPPLHGAAPRRRWTSILEGRAARRGARRDRRLRGGDPRPREGEHLHGRPPHEELRPDAARARRLLRLRRDRVPPRRELPRASGRRRGPGRRRSPRSTSARTTSSPRSSSRSWASGAPPSEALPRAARRPPRRAVLARRAAPGDGPARSWTSSRTRGRGGSGRKPVTRDISITQFVSHVRPSSAENACSQRAIPGRRRVQTNRTRIGRPSNVSVPSKVPTSPENEPTTGGSRTPRRLSAQ